MERQIKIIKPDDFHVHFRQGKELSHYVASTSHQFARALVMPNTKPSIRTAEDITRYSREIHESTLAYSEKKFTPLLTFKIYPTQTVEQVTNMKEAGAIAGKLYPQGVTTNAEDGIDHISNAYTVFDALQELNMVLCIHGESPLSFVLDREKDFIKTLSEIRKNFPRLRIVLEHLSSKESVDYVTQAKSPYLAATITVHHLLYTLDNVLGNLLKPHMFCKPVLKTPNDLKAIQQVVLDGHPSFFLGTDSAPHTLGHKECSSGCAGVFSAPVAMPLLAQFFCEQSKKNVSDDGHKTWTTQLESFCAKFGADFYKLPYNKTKLTLQQEAWTVPNDIHGVVPLCAGQTLSWKVVNF